MNIKIICKSLCALIPFGKFCGVAADGSDGNFEIKQGFFYVRGHVIFFNVPVSKS